MPTNIEDFDGCKGSEGLHAGGAVGGKAKEDGAGSKAMSEDSDQRVVVGTSVTTI